MEFGMVVLHACLVCWERDLRANAGFDDLKLLVLVSLASIY